MALTTKIKRCINRCLRHANLRLDTLTAEKVELDRLRTLERSGHFERPVFPVSRALDSTNPAPILAELAMYQSRFDDFVDPSDNEVGYTFNNDYFSSPDAEVLYTMMLRSQPEKVVEVGSGYSTKLMRQAIIDGGLNTTLISIDPDPRIENRDLADQVYREPAESLQDSGVFDSLRDGDILFIDSSHKIKLGNDVVFLYLEVLPGLNSGVLIHVHDVFLPYDYPKKWILEKRWGWNEQYLVQSLLTYSDEFEVLWAGYFAQHTTLDFGQHFRHLDARAAKSLWLRMMSEQLERD